MKTFLKNAIVKKILIVFITIIMISNFIMPNYVFANNAGTTFVNGFFYLLAWGGDAILGIMQKLMIGTFDIEEYGKYVIKYSPGIIFSNVVPALDINFINADASYNEKVYREYTDVENESEIVELIEKSNINADSFNLIEELIPGTNYPEYSVGCDDYDGSWYVINLPYGLWNYFGSWGDLSDDKVGKVLSDRAKNFGTTTIIYLDKDNMYKLEVANRTGYLYSCPMTELTKDVETIYLDSVAYKLKENIATWYVALRTRALVGLLSVLVYIGIRILLNSSSAQDKAKYKNMLKDWVVAICILFLLHYIMAFMLNITGNLNQIIKNNVVSLSETGNNTDILMNSVREHVGDIEQNTTIEMAGYVIMYLTLVILTGVFTIQYLKRVVFMAFLTIIAPMIALTYPLDKIKDGKAQAFSYWLREYIFNCLIQPVHLLLYTIFITNAIDFASENILYAIVALAFMVPAEKFIKEMFGMKSSSPTGTLGAAAGGALVMSMLNKIKAKPPKEGAEAAGAGAASSPSGTRTARQAYGTNSQVPQPQGALQPQTQNQAQVQQAQTSPQMANQGVSGTNMQQTAQGSQPKDHSQMPQAPEMVKGSKLRVAKTLGLRNIKRNWYRWKKIRKSSGRCSIRNTYWNSGFSSTSSRWRFV